MTEPLKHGSLFSGIGGFELAAEAVGWQNVFSVEYDEFCSKILEHHFPLTKHYNDIKHFNAKPYRGSIDIITGGFPCQPFSTAGKRNGVSDDRYLWPEMLRVIREVRPRFVVAENVRGLVNWSEGMVFETVLTDLEGEGFEVFPVVLPAAGVSAPHKRDRIFFIAYANQRDDSRNTGENATASAKKWLQKWHSIWKPTKPNPLRESSSNANSAGERQNNRQGKPGQFDQTRSLADWKNFPTQSPLCGGDDGLPKELDGITFPKWKRQSIKAYGNAIVPQVALQIFKAIQQSL